MTAWQVTHWLRTLVLAILAHRVLIIEFSGVLIECTRIIGTRDRPTSVFNCTHIWLVNCRDAIHILRFFNIQFMFSVWLRYWNPTLFNVWCGVTRNLIVCKGICYETLMLTTYPAVCTRSIHISVHVLNHVALGHWADMIAWTLLPIVILDHDSLICGQVSMRVLLRAQKSATTIGHALRIHILKALTNHDLMRLLLSRNRGTIPAGVLRRYLVITLELFVHLGRSSDSVNAWIERGISSIERYAHFLVRAHIILTCVRNTD
jgi:hypothetical protein